MSAFAILSRRGCFRLRWATASITTLGVAATCACAGLIVGVITKTGLALKFSSIVIDLAGGSVFWTAMYTALIVWVVGLAVPVTASYIMCAVIAAPALIKLGVPDYAAHMFIFYYAVLSEVSPPTALSPFAAAAITGGDPYRTTLQSWKYTLPAFVVPFVFVLSPEGVGLLLKTPPEGSWLGVAWIAATALAGITSLAFGVQGWLAGRLSAVERAILILAGLALVYPAPWSDIGGVAGLLAVAAAQARARWVAAAVALTEKPEAPAPQAVAQLTTLRSAYEELTEAYEAMRRMVERGYLPYRAKP